MVHRLGRLGLAAVLAALLATVLSGQTAGASKATAPGRTVLYAAVGPELTQYDLDPNNDTLIKRGSVTLPAIIQEAWPHPSRKYLYVAWSGSRGQHGVSAYRIDPASGALVEDGKPVSLAWRPIFISTDIDGTHLLEAYNNPSGLTVQRILPDGSIGAAIQQGPLDFGIYGHQVRVDPSNRAVILVTRGNGPTPTKPEDPGALKIFNYKDGVLTNRLSVAPGGGFGYQVRHLDFHPSGKWVFVTLERQNQIHVYRRMADGTLRTSPLFVKDTLMEPAKSRSGQAAASIHVHPNGRFLYVANRASGTVEFEGKRVFAGGENTIAVFSINQETGEPTLIQSIDTRGFQPRTFTLDSSGRFLVVANQSPQSVRTQTGVTVVPASLAMFRVRDDGKLEFVRKYDVETGAGRSLFWAGFVSLPR
ncbi:MAG: lactonase family protein [Bryobacteraceae bacterium]